MLIGWRIWYDTEVGDYAHLWYAYELDGPLYLCRYTSREALECAIVALEESNTL